jgi:hypothetical protein
VTFSVVAFCADALAKNVSDIVVGGTIMLSIRDRTPMKII